jgi:hypothetical protein
MKFQKQFPKEDFLKALSKTDWLKTREVADKVGCKNKLVTDTLLSMPDDVEWQWTTGGKVGTREWRLKKESE